MCAATSFRTSYHAGRKQARSGLPRSHPFAIAGIPAVFHTLRESTIACAYTGADRGGVIIQRSRASNVLETLLQRRTPSRHTLRHPVSCHALFLYHPPPRRRSVHGESGTSPEYAPSFADREQPSTDGRPLACFKKFAVELTGGELCHWSKTLRLTSAAASVTHVPAEQSASFRQRCQGCGVDGALGGAQDPLQVVGGQFYCTVPHNGTSRLLAVTVHCQFDCERLSRGTQLHHLMREVIRSLSLVVAARPVSGISFSSSSLEIAATNTDPKNSAGARRRRWWRR